MTQEIVLNEFKDINFHYFHMEIGKVIKKAKKDPRFRPLLFPFNLSATADGMYVSDHRLLFIFDGDWILIHGDEPGFGDTLQATNGVQKVLEKYFNVIESSYSLFRARLMKSYFHISLDRVKTKAKIITSIKDISKSEKETLTNLFETLKCETYSPEEWSEFFTNHIKDNKTGVWYHKIIDTFTIMVCDEKGTGFNINFGTNQSSNKDCISITMSDSIKNNLFEFFQSITKTPIPNELKEIISLAVKDGFVYSH